MENRVGFEPTLTGIKSPSLGLSATGSFLYIFFYYFTCFHSRNWSGMCSSGYHNTLLRSGSWSRLLRYQHHSKKTQQRHGKYISPNFCLLSITNLNCMYDYAHYRQENHRHLYNDCVAYQYRSVGQSIDLESI